MKKEKRITISECDRVIVSSQNDLDGFSCGDDDLDEFFLSDAFFYDKQLLGKTYYFQTKDSKRIIGAFTVANDSIKASLISNTIRNRLQSCRLSRKIHRRLWLPNKKLPRIPEV